MPSSYIHDESAKHSSSDRLPGSSSHSQLESDFHILVLLGGIPFALFGASLSCSVFFTVFPVHVYVQYI